MQFKRLISYLVLFVICLFPAVVKGESPCKIALVMKALSNPFFTKMESGAKAYANKNNISLEIFGIERENDVNRQISIVDNLISRNYDAIVIAPADSRKLVPVCKKALNNGIVVVNIDNPFHKESLTIHGISIPFIGPDNRKGAALVGEYIKKKLGGKGRVIVIEGIRGVENAELRKAGFIQEITDGSKIQVVASASANWHTDEALSLVTLLLEQNRRVDAIFCANDKMAMGAIQALDILDMTGKVLIGAYDNIEAIRNEMQNGRMHATVEQQPELMGRLGVELAVKRLQGDHIPEYVATPVDLITYESFGKRVALSISNLKNPFFAALHEGAQKSAKLLGVVLITKDAKNDNAQQLTDMESLIQQKVDAIIVNPTDTELISSGIELANEAGIPVITVDRMASGGQILCHIASDNVSGGRMAGEFLAVRLGGKGRVVEIEGIPGTSAAHNRGTGFNEIISKYKDIRVVDRKIAYFDREKARAIMKQFLKKGISVDAVFAHNDMMILGVLDALDEAHLSKRPRVLVGFDCIREARMAVQNGRLTATIAQKPEIMGKMAVQSVVGLFRGEILPQVKKVGLKLVKK